MTLSEITKPGDKIDIQLVQQLEQQQQGNTTEPIRTYKSSVFDIQDEESIEISMPTENGRMVLFQVGLRCKMLFYTKKGLYTCVAVVQRRYKSENFFVLSMKVTSIPVKFQRREFFRIDCMIPIQFTPITQEIAMMGQTEQIFMEIQNPEYRTQRMDAYVLDISGGGIRFSTEQALQEQKYILTTIRLQNDIMDQQFYLVAELISSDLNKNGEKYINRAKFLFKDLNDRETIVRFVFEEQRRLRRKENR